MKPVVCVVLAIASACSVSAKPEAIQNTPSESQSAVLQRTDLSSLLLIQAAPGYVVVDKDTKQQSIDDVAQQADDPSAERIRLQERGFVQGFIRTWASNDDSQNVIEAIVYEFSNAQGAKDEQLSDLSDARAEKDQTFSVPGVDGAVGVQRKPPAGAEQDTIFAVSFVRTTHYYLISIGGPTPHSAQEIISLATKLNAVAR